MWCRKYGIYVNDNGYCEVIYFRDEKKGYPKIHCKDCEHTQPYTIERW